MLPFSRRGLETFRLLVPFRVQAELKTVKGEKINRNEHESELDDGTLNGSLNGTEQHTRRIRNSMEHGRPRAGKHGTKNGT